MKRGNTYLHAISPEEIQIIDKESGRTLLIIEGQFEFGNNVTVRELYEKGEEEWKKYGIKDIKEGSLSYPNFSARWVEPYSIEFNDGNKLDIDGSEGQITLIDKERGLFGRVKKVNYVHLHPVSSLLSLMKSAGGIYIDDEFHPYDGHDENYFLSPVTKCEIIAKCAVYNKPIPEDLDELTEDQGDFDFVVA